MGGHQRHRVVEDHPPRVDVDDVAGRVEREALGAFIQALAETTEMLPRMPVSDDRDAGPEVRPRLQTAPAVDVDGDEDRLGEEEDPLEGERDAERLAPLAHEPRPQQPELERQHGPGNGADGERHGHVLRPSLGQLQGGLVVVLDAPVVGDQGHRRPRHAERHQDDVEGERERHLRPRPRHRIDRQHRLDEAHDSFTDHRATSQAPWGRGSVPPVKLIASSCVVIPIG